MASFVDQDQQWLLNCLTATLDTSHEVRSFAEASLSQASSQPGFGVALSKVAINRELPLGLTHYYLAAVLLKQFIKKHWQEDEESFEPPAVASEEKEVIRKLLLLSLNDDHGKICTAISMAIASIAQYDWPEDWSELLPALLALISDQTSMSGVRGALRCLALLSVDLDDRSVPGLVPALFPCLHKVVSSPEIYDKTLRAKALSVVHSCTSMLGVMSGVYKTETDALVVPMLKSWLEQFSAILQPSVISADPEDWSIRMEVFKCLTQFLVTFISSHFFVVAVILPPLWHTFVSSLKVYELSSVEGADDYNVGRYDSDGAGKSLEDFVIQLFELLLTLVGSSRFAKVIKSNIKDLVYYTIAYMQMTEQQVHTWSLDANQYVADEDEATYSYRVSGTLLLEEVVNSYVEDGINAIVEACQKRFNESRQEKAMASANWWRLREATIFALVSVSEPLLEAQSSESCELNLGTLLEQILTEDMATGLHEYPFLHARALSAVAKFSSVVSQGILDQFLFASIKAVGSDVPPPVKVGACRALSQLLPESSKGIVQSQLMALFSSLTDLLKHASDETLHLVLETLQATVKSGHEAIVSIEPIISPILLNMWASYVSDPFISIDAVEVLEAIKDAPGCIRPLVSRVLPSIGPILEKHHQQPAGLVAGSLDLLTMLLKASTTLMMIENAPVDVVKAIHDVCFSSVIQIILQSSDHAEIQNATECLAAFVFGGKQEILAWGGDQGLKMRSLLDAASRLLSTEMESSGSLFVGSYILQLILHLPSQMSQHVRDLIAALIRRMLSCQIAGLKSSLLVVFARLVHMSGPNVEQFIDLLITLPADGYENSLAYVMSEWTRQQGEIQGSYQIKVTTSALALLLSTRHAELAKICVKGHLIKSNAGITTRSKAKVTPDQWTVMPLPAKILALLADTLIEIQEQVVADDDEDSDWEEMGENDAEQDLLHTDLATSHGRPNLDYLMAMAKVYSENQEDDHEDELLPVADPLNEINLANYLVDFLVKFSASDQQLFDHLCQHLTPAQWNAIQRILQR
ncbi:hypothetical protein Scep_022311 [Stephania cephalantha]|uniref:Importin N-terminal domain-containing protein n=1 Tax=Stephania cephalantha TaxID=152367 RepID=A0AAP0FAQ6_9MAGN